MKLSDYLFCEKPATGSYMREPVPSELFKMTLDMYDEISELLEHGYSWTQICSAAKQMLIAKDHWDPRWDMWKVKEFYKLICANGGSETCPKQ